MADMYTFLSSVALHILLLSVGLADQGRQQSPLFPSEGGMQISVAGCAWRIVVYLMIWVCGSTGTFRYCLS